MDPDSSGCTETLRQLGKGVQTFAFALPGDLDDNDVRVIEIDGAPWCVAAGRVRSPSRCEET